MGKYSGISLGGYICDNFHDAVLVEIANELAEANRLHRIDMQYEYDGLCVEDEA